MLRKYWTGWICKTKARAPPCEQKLIYSNVAEEMENVQTFREAVGSLIYLATCTRPDLTFVVSKLSQYFTKPTSKQWTKVKHTLRYLKGTQNKVLSFKKYTDNVCLE